MQNTLYVPQCHFSLYINLVTKYVSLETTYLFFCQKKKKKKKEFAETVVKYFCGKIYMYFFREKVKKIR